MAYCFGDSFDLYATTADAITGYWDSGTTSNFTLQAGRFGGRCLQNTGVGGVYLVKSSGANDAIHHLVCAFQQSAVLSGATLGTYLQLSDGATNQCCIVFRSDGAILLTSAAPAGTVLATYTGAVTLINQWFAFEFEVVIHPTAGRFRVRKNGNASDDFDSGATLPTRPGANSYANKLTLGQSASIAFHWIDDLLWRSDASSVPFVGDVRCYTRMPVSDASVVFSHAPSSVVQNGPVANSVVAVSNTQARFAAMTPAISGLVTSVTIVVTSGNAGNLKCAIFADNGSNAPGVALGSATAPVTPVAVGNNVFTFSPGISVTKGTQYWIGGMCDTSTGLWTASSGGVSTGTTATASYATFPQNNPVTTGSSSVIGVQWTYGGTSNNWPYVADAQQDGATSYVYSSNVGDTDLYNITPIGVTPASTVAVTTRAFVQKSDAGSRSGKVVLKSGGTTVDTGSAPLSTTWAQMYRTDTVDPATGTAWTAVGVNAAQIGVTVAS
jgi:hypothetical protein